MSEAAARPPWLRRILVIALTALAAIGLMTFAMFASTRSSPDIGGPFALTDQDGRAFTNRDLRGKPFVVFFGFTFCPDACPLALTKVRLALDSMGADADRIQTVFITIDPERDTSEQLALYVKSNGFPNGLIGLTGTPEEIQAVADEYRVHYRRIESDDNSAGYLMEHSTVLYLMDSNGRFAGVFSHGSTPDEIAEGLRQQLAEG